MTLAVAPMTGAERLLAALRCQPVDRTPVWYMRQAGGALPRYLALRERHSVEAIATTPALCAEVSLMPLEAYGVDAVVMYADILLPVAAMGVGLRLTAEGPVLERPVRAAADVARLRPLEPEAGVGPILEAIGLVRAGAGGRAAVVGICGGPFTLACYLVEGRASRDQLGARQLMRREPGLWADLLERLTGSLEAYVEAQVRAGAQAVQLFDTYAGVLGPTAYRRFAAPYATRVLDAVRAAGAPAIHYVRSSAGILADVATAGGDAIAIDATQSIADAWPRLPAGRAIQGNLDPALLAAGWPALAEGARAVLADAAATGRTGHVFNLGQAGPRDTDPGVLRDLAAFVHETPSPIHAPGGLP